MLRVYLVFACSEAVLHRAVIIFSLLSARCCLSQLGAHRQDLRERCETSSANIDRGFETGWETLLLHTGRLCSANIQVQVLIDTAGIGDGVPYITLKAWRVIVIRSNRGVGAAPRVLSDLALLTSWEHPLINFLVVPGFQRSKIIKCKQFPSIQRITVSRENNVLYSKHPPFFCKIFLWYLSFSLNVMRVSFERGKNVVFKNPL